jgi:hypothetical protein
MRLMESIQTIVRRMLAGDFVKKAPVTFCALRQHSKYNVH